MRPEDVVIRLPCWEHWTLRDPKRFESLGSCQARWGPKDSKPGPGSRGLLTQPARGLVVKEGRKGGLYTGTCMSRTHLLPRAVSLLSSNSHHELKIDVATQLSAKNQKEIKAGVVVITLWQHTSSIWWARPSSVRKKTLVGFLNKRDSKRSLTKETHHLMLLLLIDNVTRRLKAVDSECSAAAGAL